MCLSYIENGDESTSTITEVISNEHEANFLKLDSSKANSRLAWVNIYSLEQGLSETVYWYKGFLGGKNVRELCELQIEEFMRINQEID